MTSSARTRDSSPPQVQGCHCVVMSKERFYFKVHSTAALRASCGCRPHRGSAAAAALARHHKVSGWPDSLWPVDVDVPDILTTLERIRCSKCTNMLGLLTLWAQRAAPPASLAPPQPPAYFKLAGGPRG